MFGWCLTFDAVQILNTTLFHSMVPELHKFSSSLWLHLHIVMMSLDDTVLAMSFPIFLMHGIQLSDVPQISCMFASQFILLSFISLYFQILALIFAITICRKAHKDEVKYKDKPGLH